jgi:glc operon protein GlcG
MHMRSTLSQSDVEFLIVAAVRAARAQGLKVSIAVCDDGGHELGMLRMDGASPFTAGMAREKAHTAAFCRKDSAHYEGVVRERVAFLSAPGIGGLIEGGVVVLVDGQCAGSVGVSGAKSDQDAQIAREAIEALRSGTSAPAIPPG